MDSAIQLAKLRLDGGTQPRVKIDTDVVDDYAERIKAGDEFPPVVVFHDGAAHWLAEGFHRYHAHAKAGKKTIRCDIRKGTVRDAILFSCGANVSHGLRRKDADKRRAVETLLQDDEWKAKSDKWIAETCVVSQPFVKKVKDELDINIYVRKRQDGTEFDSRNMGRPKREPVASTVDDFEPEQPTRPVAVAERPKANGKPAESNIIGDGSQQIITEAKFVTENLADFQVVAIYEQVRLWMAADLEKRGLKP